MEVRANEGVDVYRELYFEGGVSSVYFWDLEGEGFAGVVLLKKCTFSDLLNTLVAMKARWGCRVMVGVGGNGLC